MEDRNSIHPQDGNQVVVGKNEGTINIHNHSKGNEEAVMKLLAQSEEMNQLARGVVEYAKSMVNKLFELEISKSKKKSKK